MQARAIAKKFRKMKRELEKKPRDIEMTAKLEEYIDKVPGLLDPLRRKIEELVAYNGVLDDFRFRTGADYERMKWDVISWPGKAENLRAAAIETAAECRTRYLDDMLAEQERFSAMLNAVEVEVEQFAQRCPWCARGATPENSF